MLDLTQRPALQYTSDPLAWLSELSSDRTRRSMKKQPLRSEARQLAMELRRLEREEELERIRDGEWPVIPEASGFANHLGWILDRYI